MLVAFIGTVKPGGIMTQVYLSQALPSYRVVYICRNGDEAPFDKYMFMVFQDKISHAAQSVLELAL